MANYSEWYELVAASATNGKFFNINKIVTTAIASPQIAFCLPLTIEWLLYHKNDWDTFWEDALSTAGISRLEAMRISQAGNQKDQINSVLNSLNITRGVIVNNVCDKMPYLQFEADNFYENFLIKQSERFNVMCLSGTEGAHAIGIYRKFKTIGKSNSFYVFDPNMGAFYFEIDEKDKASGKSKFKKIIEIILEEVYVYNYDKVSIYALEMNKLKKKDLTI